MVTLLSPPSSARAGRESASTQLARVEVSSQDHDMLVHWYFCCSMFVYPLLSWAPAWEAPSRGSTGVFIILCHKSGQGLKAVHKQHNSASSPAPASL